MGTYRDPEAEFLNAESFAVAGASENPDKYGHMCFASLLRHRPGHVYPLNPRAKTVLGVKAYASIADLPEVPAALSIVTPPEVTEKVVDEALAAGVRHFWMQPGAESMSAVKKAQAAGASVIWGGSCLLVVIRTYR